MIEFTAWPKIARGNPLDVVITEKLDGTNACIVVDEATGEVGAQSRRRLITPTDDNFGFASWVEANKHNLLLLGGGHHYSEWVGEGIQGNPHEVEGRKFFLFNTHRWNRDTTPPCCDVVPTLYTGELEKGTISFLLAMLEEGGSVLGGKAEGFICYSPLYNRMSKHTILYSGGKWNGR